MVFLSVSDSADVGIEFIESAGNDDEVLAKELQREEAQLQLYGDARLAEQLQLKENSYMRPR